TTRTELTPSRWSSSSAYRPAFSHRRSSEASSSTALRAVCQVPGARCQVGAEARRLAERLAIAVGGSGARQVGGTRPRRRGIRPERGGRSGSGTWHRERSELRHGDRRACRERLEGTDGGKERAGSLLRVDQRRAAVADGVEEVEQHVMLAGAVAGAARAGA